MVFLQNDRYVEFHAAHGRHYRLRIPRFGYDMKYHTPSCDLFVCGASSEIYRLNLERGQFLQSLKTQSTSSVNCCEINADHHLICFGTQEGTVEAWDPRDKNRVGVLDVAINVPKFKTFPSISAMKFKDSLQLGVGTQSGHVLVFDIRSSQPMIVKDHLNQFPIKQIAFNPSQNAVYSMDTAIFKIWNETSGKQIAYIESDSSFNDFTTIPNTGLVFFAQDDVKMLTYYIPLMGPAPRWCSFLDNLTEEIESENIQNIYDDYKFITKQELVELSMEHLEGTNLLRAYMHGYFQNIECLPISEELFFVKILFIFFCRFFVDIRLYNKARAAIEPFAFEKYRKEKIRQQIEASRPARLKIKSNLPAVNQELALKYMDDNENIGRKKPVNLLKDDRFKALFSNPEFEVDKNADEYKMLTPVLSRLQKSKVKELKRKVESTLPFMDEDQKAKSSDDDLFSEKEEDEMESSDDDDCTWQKDLKQTYRQIRIDNKSKVADDENSIENESEEQSQTFNNSKPSTNGKNIEFKVKNVTDRSTKYVYLLYNNQLTMIDSPNECIFYRKSLGDRLKNTSNEDQTRNNRLGSTQMAFTIEKKSKYNKQRDNDTKKHREELKNVIRPVKSLHLKKYIPKS